MKAPTNKPASVAMKVERTSSSSMSAPPRPCRRLAPRLPSRPRRGKGGPRRVETPEGLAAEDEPATLTGPQVEALATSGVPVIGHLGLTPQSVNLLGGYRVQGRGEAGEHLLRDAKAMEAAGACAIVLEVVPAELAARVSEVLTIPTIGIGAGGATDAQVIVWQDLVGLTEGPLPRFVKTYADVRTTMSDAVSRWGADVVSGAYPAAEHQYE